MVTIRNGNTSEIERFQLYNEDNAGDEIIVVEQAGAIVAYAQVTDCNIFFLESEAKGAGRDLVEYLQGREYYLIAKAVEETARGFWAKMGFQFANDGEFDGDEDWDWEE